MELKGNSLKGGLQLSSNAADMGIDEYRFTTNLDTALHVNSPAVSQGIDISGTYFHLNGTRLSTAEGQSSQSWHTLVDITKGKLKLMLPESEADGGGFLEYYKGLKGNGLSAVLGTEEDIQVSGSVSDLSWLNVLLQNRVGFAVSGAGELFANIALEQGMPARGTKLTVHPLKLGVEVLDYTAEGKGEKIKAVKQDGEWLIEVNDYEHYRIPEAVIFGG